MKKLALLLAGTLAFGTLAFAQNDSLNITFDDSGFAYYNLEEGYVNLDFQDGELVLTLSDQPGSAAFNVDNNRDEPIAENDDDALTQSYLREAFDIETFWNGVQVFYDEATLETVVDAYNTLFSSQGFDASVERDNANSHVMVFERGDQMARVVFISNADGVQVRLSTL